MSKILDKLGIYDLVAVLLSGISISTFTILVLQLIYKIQIDTNLQVNETLLFFVLSYFLGLIFQEISSFIQKKSTHKNNRLLKAALKTSSNSLDKDQSISSMGRSLSLYFALLAFVVLINSFFQPSTVKIILVIISVCFAILLQYRCIRFAKLRYINIFRTFYYKVIVK